MWEIIAFMWEVNEHEGKEENSVFLSKVTAPVDLRLILLLISRTVCGIDLTYFMQQGKKAVSLDEGFSRRHQPIGSFSLICLAPICYHGPNCVP